MKMSKKYVLISVFCGIFLLLVIYQWFSLFRSGERAVFKMSINSVAVSLMEYKDKFAGLPPSLEVLCREFPESEKMVYLGYSEWPLGKLNGAMLLYNNNPAADPQNPLADVLLAAPVSTGDERVVAFYGDYKIDKRSLGCIKEQDFSGYWTKNKQNLLLPKNVRGSTK